MTKNINSIVCFYFTYSELHKTFFSKTQQRQKNISIMFHFKLEFESRHKSDRWQTIEIKKSL